MKSIKKYRVETSYPWQKNQYRWLPEHENITLKRAREVKKDLIDFGNQNFSKFKVRIVKTTISESVVK